MSGLPEFTMRFEPTTIEHLGLKLYVSLPPVIGELVSNSWDADAGNVWVTIPNGPITEDSEVVVKDDGNGMNAEELQDAYLRIGRNCREELGRDVSERNRRPLMGRKGIGKLSAFGVATELEVRSVKDGNAVCLRLNYDDMKAVPPGQVYHPKVVPELTGKAKEWPGTEVRIRGLRRRKPISENWVRRELARRYTVFDKKFKVLVNGTQLSPEDRRLKEGCRKAWDVSEMPGGAVVEASAGWKVDGWIGLVEKSSQIDRGVDVFARGKAVEMDTMFGLKTTDIQFARAYVVGEISAEFLDAAEDNIATGRNSVHWESEEGQKLQDWGQKALKWVFEQWRELQAKEKEKKIVKTADFDKWLSMRNEREKRVAAKMVKAIVQDPNIEPEAAGPLLEIVKTNIEFTAFQELVDEIEKSGISIETLLRLIADWRIIEAREHLKLADGRLAIMEKLSEYIQKGAPEVQKIQPLFEEHGWLVDPSWGEVTGQTTYTTLLRKHFPESKSVPEENKRIDILGYSVGGTLTIVELKRPQKTLSREDLDQIERYRDWANANLIGTGPDSPVHIRGLLIVGQLSGGEIHEKMQRLAGVDIRVETFGDILERARKVYGEVEDRLRRIAPEYSKQARRARKPAPAPATAPEPTAVPAQAEEAPPQVAPEEPAAPAPTEEPEQQQ
jgi:hypothetical protein